MTTEQLISELRERIEALEAGGIAPATMTVAEAAVYVPCSEDTIYRNIESGKLRASTPDQGPIRIRRKWLDDWIDKCAPLKRTSPRPTHNAEQKAIRPAVARQRVVAVRR